MCALFAQDLVSQSDEEGSSDGESSGDEGEGEEEEPQAPLPDDGEGSDFDELQARVTDAA